MLEKFIKNLAKNYIYIIWTMVYFSIAWLMLGADKYSFILVFFLYGISIIIALSPLGEVLLRFIEKVRPISTRKEKEYLLRLYMRKFMKTLNKKTRNLAII